jgi:hypothetical protein
MSSTWLRAPGFHAVEPTTSIARTLPETLGFQSRSAPVASSNAAAWLRAVNVLPTPTPIARSRCAVSPAPLTR